jgi:hypothetical protein
LHPAVHGAIEIEAIHDLNEHKARQDEGDHHTKDGYELASAVTNAITTQFGAEESCNCGAK